MILTRRADSLRLRMSWEVPIPGEFILSRRRFGVAAVLMPRAHGRVRREEEEKRCRG